MCVPIAGLHVIMKEVGNIVIEPSDLVVVWKELADSGPTLRKRPLPTDVAGPSEAIVALTPGRQPRPTQPLVMVGPSPGEVSASVVELTNWVSRLSIEKAQLAKSRAYYKAKCLELRQTLHEQSEQHREVLALVEHRPGSRKVSTYAGFNLALKRNLGHSSCQALVLAVAGDDVHGSLKSKHIVTRFEHKASCAVRVFSSEFHASGSAAMKVPPDVHMLRQKCSESSSWFCVSAFSYRGDATNDVLRNSKVHLAEVCSPILGREGVLEADVGRDREDACSVTVLYSRSFCDMHLVSFDNGQEIYHIMRKEFSSVGATCWAKVVEECALDKHKLFIFALALDNGPDNQGATSRLKNTLEGNNRVTFAVTWCVFHQYHLIIRSMLLILDKFVWPSPSAAFPTTYFAGVSCISNSWRAAGVPRKIYFAGCEAFGDVAGARCFKKIPGKVLREGWGSIDSVESLIDNGGQVLAAAFQKVVGARLGSRPRQSTGPGADLDADFAERARNGRQHACDLIGNDVFMGMVRISLIAKGPLAKFFYWAQKQRGLMTKKRKDAEESGEAYVGPTLLSQLVVVKVEAVLGEMCNLLEPEALDDERRWGLVWKLVAGHELDAKILILDLVLTGIASWSMRFGVLAIEFPPPLPCRLGGPPAARVPQEEGIG